MEQVTLSEQKKEDWMNSKWRPMMGWMYMLVCTCDFVVFPILWSLVQVVGGGRVETQWSPITLQGAGLFHMAMGAVLGVAAFGRTQEKLAGVNNDKATTFTQPTGNSIPTPGPSNIGSTSSANPGFGESPTSTSRSGVGSISSPATSGSKQVVPVGNEPEL